MRSEKLQAFVLSTHDYGESDLIVSLFTLEHGHIKGFARGGRKSRKRFGSSLELLARIDLQARCKEGLSSLQQGESISLYPQIRSDLSLIAHGLYSAELLDILTPEGHPYPRIFRLFSAWMEHLESGAFIPADRRFFEINLLNILGYRPALDHCSCCSETYGSRGALVMKDGELGCRQCARGGQPVNSETLVHLQRALATGSFGKGIFSDDSLQQAGMILDRALAHHAGRTIKSLSFLNQMTE